MFSLEKHTSFVFTELAMDPNDAGTCFVGINLLPENNHIARPKSPKYMFTARLAISLCCGILLTPLRWFKQIKRTVSFDVTTRFNAIQQSTAMYNSHIFNVRNTTINVTKRSTIN